jgi:predicted amino acid racemase
MVAASPPYPNYLWENETIDSLENVVETIQETYAKGIGGIATEKNVFAQDVFMDKARSFLAENRDILRSSGAGINFVFLILPIFSVLRTYE